MTWPLANCDAAAALALLAVLHAGCAPIAGTGRARTLSKGRWELNAAPEVALVTGRLASGDVPLPSGQLVVAGHYGLSETKEVGARLWGFSLGEDVLQSWGASADAKFQLKRASNTHGTRETDIGFAPRLTYHSVSLGGTPEHAFGASVPLVFGWRAGRFNQWVLSARYDYQVLTSESQTPLQVHLGGGSAGFVWQINERWALMPELALLYSLLSFNGESGSQKGRGLSVLAFGLGGAYGR